MKPIQMISRFGVAVVMLSLAIAPAFAGTLANNFEGQTEGVGGGTSVAVSDTNGDIVYSSLLPAPGVFEFEYANVSAQLPVGMYLATGYITTGDGYAVPSLETLDISLANVIHGSTFMDSLSIDVYELGIADGSVVNLEGIKNTATIASDSYTSVAGTPTNPMVVHTLTISSVDDAFDLASLNVTGSSTSIFGLLDSVSVSYVIPGDANKDDVVNAQDLGTLLAEYGSGTTWLAGDFNGDDTVNAQDLGALLAGYGTSAPEAAPTATPEPGTLAMLGVLGLIGGLRRRRA